MNNIVIKVSPNMKSFTVVIVCSPSEPLQNEDKYLNRLHFLALLMKYETIKLTDT